MAKVTASDLAGANTGNMSGLTTVIEASQQAIGALNVFVYESPDHLKGGGYDAVRVKMELYTKVFQALNMICTNYETIAKNANNSMLNFMEGYASLDDSKLDEYTTRLKQIDGYLKYLKEKSASVDDTNSYATTINYWTGIYKDLYHYKELLQKLAGTDNSLWASFDKVFADIENITRSAAGISDNTFTSEGMEAFKKGKGKLYDFNPKMKVFTPDIDTSKMSSKAKEVLEMLQENWPDGMEAQRYIAIQTALSLLDKGIYYSQPGRHAKKKDGTPISMDCSSFVTYCLMAAGQKIQGTDRDPSAYTGSYLNSKYYKSINRKDLMPGDVALINGSTSGGSSNHIGMYLGKDRDGKEVWIEMSGPGIFVSHGKKSWTIFKRYTGYTND